MSPPTGTRLRTRTRIDAGAVTSPPICRTIKPRRFASIEAPITSGCVYGATTAIRRAAPRTKPTPSPQKNGGWIAKRLRDPRAFQRLTHPCRQDLVRANLAAKLPQFINKTKCALLCETRFLARAAAPIRRAGARDDPPQSACRIDRVGRRRPASRPRSENIAAAVQGGVRILPRFGLGCAIGARHDAAGNHRPAGHANRTQPGQ